MTHEVYQQLHCTQVRDIQLLEQLEDSLSSHNDVALQCILRLVHILDKSSEEGLVFKISIVCVCVSQYF